MFYDDLKCLYYPLPEDLAALKGYGDYGRLRRAIDARLADADVPEAMKTRLRLEREMAERIPREYPYSHDDALAMLREAIDGFTAEELELYRDRGWVEWKYIDGEVRFFVRFLKNLIKVHPELAPRVRNTGAVQAQREQRAFLDDTINAMRQSGGAARRFHIRHTLKIDPAFVRPGAEVLVHLPLPVEYDCVRNFHLISAAPDAVIAPPQALQRTASFRRALAPDDVFSVEYSFETHMRYTAPRPEDARPGLPADLGDALSEQPPHIAFTPLVRRVARDIAGDEQNPLRIARRVYDFLTQKPLYSFMRNYFTYPNLSEYMLSSLKGDCGVFALTFITLCRALGVPARWQSGVYLQPGDVGSHDWAQFYCEPWGWLPVDVSFGNSAWHNGSAPRHDFYFGNLDPFRLPAARAFQQPFDPPKKHLRNDPYDNQIGEAEYADQGLAGKHFDSEITVLDCAVIQG